MPKHQNQTNCFTITSFASYLLLAVVFSAVWLRCACQIITITLAIGALPDKTQEFWHVLKLNTLAICFMGCIRFALICIDRAWAVNVLAQSSKDCLKTDEARFGFVQSVIGTLDYPWANRFKRRTSLFSRSLDSRSG